MCHTKKVKYETPCYKEKCLYRDKCPESTTRSAICIEYSMELSPINGDRYLDGTVYIDTDSK